MIASRRQPFLVALAFLVSFVGGAGSGLVLADRLAPGSSLANAISFLLFPLALAVGFQMWVGLAILLLIPGFIARLVRGAAAAPPRPSPQAIPPGAWSFLVVSVVFALAGGAVVGVLSDRHPVWLVAAIYGGVGSTYGLLLWQLARRGYLPFPESS